MIISTYWIPIILSVFIIVVGYLKTQPDSGGVFPMPDVVTPVLTVIALLVNWLVYFIIV